MEFVGKNPEKRAVVQVNKEREEDAYCVDCAPVDNAELAPVDRIVVPSDVAEFSEDDDTIYIIGTREGKVTQIMGLEKMKKLKVWNFITNSLKTV